MSITLSSMCNRRRDHFTHPIPINLNVVRRVANHPRQVQRTQIARFVRQQRLFTTVVDVEPVCVESVYSGNRHVEHVLIAVGGYFLHRGREAFPVQFAFVIAQEPGEFLLLVTVRKPDQAGKPRDVIAGYDQLVLAPRRIGSQATAPVRQHPMAEGPPFPVDARCNPQPQQHPLQPLPAGPGRSVPGGR